MNALKMCLEAVSSSVTEFLGQRGSEREVYYISFVC